MPKLTLNEFKRIPFEPYLPSIILDLIEHLCGLRIKNFAHLESEKAKINAQKEKYANALNAELQRNPSNFNENVFQERYYQLHKTKEQAILEEFQEDLGEETFNKLWNFFKFISGHPPPPYEQWETHTAFTTQDKVRRLLPKWWGHPCDFLKEVMFQSMSSQNNSLARLYFFEFIPKFWIPLTSRSAEFKERMRIVFNMLDFDGDGFLKAQDLHKAI